MTDTSVSERRAMTLIVAGFLLVVPVIAHLAYSRLGFNPTDDGLILAGARRILNGEIPHRDFISVRTAGSYYLHAPIVWAGGDYTIWISRLFVWFEFAAIAMSWTRLAQRTGLLIATPLQACAIALIAFVLSSFTFPIFAWHSIDALFLVSLGLYLATAATTPSKVTGYLLIGAASLARQNFLPLLPISLFVLGDWKNPRLCVAAVTPLLGYGALLLATGGMGDAVRQLSAHDDLFRIGVDNYIRRETVVGLALGLMVSMLADPALAPLPGVRTTPRLPRFVAAAVAAGGLAFSCLTVAANTYPAVASFGLFGAAVGVAAYSLFRMRTHGRLFRLSLIAATVAWAISLSIGVPNPSLAGAPLAVICIVVALPRTERTFLPSWKRIAVSAVLAALSVLALVSQGYARREYVYRDAHAAGLTAPLDGILNGAALINSNPNVRDFLSDLRDAVAALEESHSRYAIIPDIAAYWIRSPQSNPLPVDWAQSTELPTSGLRDKVIGSLDSQRGNLVILVQKVEASELARGFVPLGDSDRYALVRHVRSNYTKVGETRYFDLYK